MSARFTGEKNFYGRRAPRGAVGCLGELRRCLEECRGQLERCKDAGGDPRACGEQHAGCLEGCLAGLRACREGASP